MDVNKFADLTVEEVMSKYTGHNIKQHLMTPYSKLFSKKTIEDTQRNNDEIPSKVDWDALGHVSEPKNQERCASCWAFAAATTIESHASIYSGYNISNGNILSTQQLVDCTPNPKYCGGYGGCHGATAQLAYEYTSNLFYTQSLGLTDENTYPYVSEDGLCDFPSSNKQTKVVIKSYSNVPTNSKTSFLKALATKGPLSVTIASSSLIFYSEGIFDGCTENDDRIVNHAVVAIGYDVTDENNSYITLRNSWGDGWGENGNLRLRLHGIDGKEACVLDPYPQDGSGCEGDTDPIIVCGECGVLADASYPIGVQVVSSMF